MSAKLNEYRSSIEHALEDRNKPWTSFFDQAEAKTGLPRVYLFAGLVAFTGLYLVFGFGAELICNSIAVLYPAYMSMKALESPQKDDDTKWLTYWTVYACFSLVEYFADTLVGWFPLYWLTKCVFFVWCYMPTEYNGSLIIYHRLIKPYYLKHHGRIDDMAHAGRASRPIQAADLSNRRLTADEPQNVQAFVKDVNQRLNDSMKKMAANAVADTIKKSR